MTARPQGVLTPLTSAAIFLVVGVDSGGEPVVRELLADVSALTRSVGFRIGGAGLTCVVGIGSAAWDRLFGPPRPAGLHPFVELKGPKHHAVATPGDILFHIRATEMDLCFELATQIMARLAGAVTAIDEVHGFKYFDERDLIGFVDGTENPPPDVAVEHVIVGEEDPDFAGGSYVVVQKYIHDMDAWNALPVEEQERVIGRTKLSDIEMPDEIKPADSHVALTTIEDPDGTEHKIVRYNMPFGVVGKGEFGTYFIGYSRTPDVTEQMLRNMFLGDPPASHDRILDFSTALTGNLFFAPSADFLDDPPEPAVQTAVAAQGPAEVDRPAIRDGSLGIGSLRNRPSGSSTP